MHEDEQRIIDAQHTCEEADATRRTAIETALRNRTVKQERIAEIIGKSRETVRVMARDAGIEPDKRYVRKVTR